MTLEDAARLLAEAGIENPRGEARRLLAHALGTDRDATLNADPTPEQAQIFAALVARRAAREPFAYITGRREFWSLDLEVGPGVLVPRPDSETLIEQALLLPPPRTIADLGTGSGALLIAALTEFPAAMGTGFELSPDAFGYARRNADRLAPGRADIRLADWNTAQGPFDLIFSNPPYIPAADIAVLDREVRDQEPASALDGGPDGLDCHRGLAGLLPRLLAPGGHALLEIGMGQAPAMTAIFAGSRLELVRIAPDLAGIPRCVVLAAPG